MIGNPERQIYIKKRQVRDSLSLYAIFLFKLVVNYLHDLGNGLLFKVSTTY